MNGPNGKTISELRHALKGTVIAPQDSDYDGARTTFYGGIDRRPFAIVRAADADDIARVVSLAREDGLELAIRSGGHSIAGHCVSEGGIVLDLTRMKGLEINPPERTAWAETGLTAGEYTKATAVYGLATGFGDAGSVGIGGITLGGGIGFLVRKHGLTIDSLLAAEIVTVDGNILEVDSQHHPDLFWAIRGGGGNFGVATRFKFQLHPVNTVVGGMLILPATPDVIASFVSAAEEAPEELSTIANVMNAPPMPFLPAEVHGKPVVMSSLVYAGDVEKGRDVVARFQKIAAPIANMLKPMPYPEIYPPEMPGFHPRAIGRTMFTTAVDRTVAENILHHLSTSNALMRVAQIRVLGGAMARVPIDATAYAHRTERIMVNVAAVYEKPDEPASHAQWVNAFASSIPRNGSGAYVGFLGEEGESRVRDAYPGKTWERLAAIKRQYDPANLFRLNQNITPSKREV